MSVGFTPKDKAAQNRKSLSAEDPKKNGRRGRRKALISKWAFLNVMRVSRVVMFVGFTPKDKAAQNRKSLTAEEPKKNGRRGRRKAVICKWAFPNLLRG